jgi:hypothetical protein
MKFPLPALLLCLAVVAAPIPARADAAELRQKHSELRDHLRQNPYGRAMHIDSTESPDRLTGDVYAVLDHPFATVSDSLREPARWCDVLILPFNTKYCHAVKANGAPALQVRIGRKVDQPVEQASKLVLAFRQVAAQPDYFDTQLRAAEGPVGTRDYRIGVAAIPLENGKRTFLRLNYSYGFGFAGRTAMQMYLSTAGSDKIGFTVTGRDANGQPEYIRGVRGVVERNAMRYYLAVDAYLDSLAAPKGQQVDSRIRSWFAATERYPRQLREMDATTYASMKRQEVERQQTLIE